jgi:hypothetical protein
MTLNDLLEQIESVHFAAQMNIFSGFRSFRRALVDHEYVNALMDYLRQHPHEIERVFQRFLDLLEKNDRPEFLHPYDPALACYLWVLGETSPRLVSLAVEQALRTPRLWWARKLAQHILEKAQKTGSQTIALGLKRAPNVVFSPRYVFSPTLTDDEAIFLLYHFAGLQPLRKRLSFGTSSRDVGPREENEVDHASFRKSATNYQIGRMAE